MLYSKTYSKCPKCGKNGTVTLKEIITAIRHGAVCINIEYHAHCHLCGITFDSEHKELLHNFESIKYGGRRPMKGKSK